MEGRCLIENKAYDPGAEVCDDKLCYVCRGGEWEVRSSLEYFFGGP